MPFVRVTHFSLKSASPNRTSTKNHVLTHLPVLQPPTFPQSDEFDNNETLDQTLYTQDIYNYQTTTTTTMMILDQNVPLITTYYSNQIPIQHAHTNHQTFQHLNPSHTSYAYYNR